MRNISISTICYFIILATFIVTAAVVRNVRKHERATQIDEKKKDEERR